MLAFPIFFAFLWAVVLKVISVFGGWAGVAEQYPASARPEGVTYSMRSLRLGLLGRYNNCITATLSRGGIYLIPFGPFRLGHPPILIPWSCVEDVEVRRLIFRECLVSIRAGGRSIRLHLPESSVIWMSENLQSPKLPRIPAK